jgi:flagellar hook-associated protein 2
MTTTSATPTATTNVGPLDVNTLVSQLMTVESIPLTQLQRQDSQVSAQISAYGALNSSLSTFQTAMKNLGQLSQFQAYSATSSDNTVLTATASSTAATGTNTVQVVSAAVQSAMVSTTSFAPTDTLAAGLTTTINVGSTAFTVNIGGMTLTQAAAAINSASDNAGVTANVSNVNSGSKLLLTANNTGSTSALSVSYNGTDPFTFASLNTDSNGVALPPSALDAVMILNGNSSLTRTSSSNTVSDLIGGVTLNLLKPGTITVNVANNTSTVTSNVQSFVSAYNALQSALVSQSTGTLQGNNDLLSIQSNIQSVFNTPSGGSTGAYSYLAQIGVTMQKDGTMALDTTALNSALSTNFTSVANLFANSTQGVANRLGTVVGQMLDTTTGLIATSTDSLNTTLKSLKNDETQLQTRLSNTQQSLLSQYNALNAMLSSMQTTSNYLTQQLANLPGFR